MVFFMRARFFVLLVMLAAFSLGGCVTEATRDGKIVADANPKKDKTKALNDYVNLAVGYMNDGKREQALRAINNGLAIDPNSPEMLNVLAGYYRADGEMDLAEKQFKKAISAKSSYTPSYLNYGTFLYAQKRYPEACKMFEKASADVMYSKRSGAFSNLGMCLKQIGKNKEAEEAFGRSIGHDSTNGKALFGMADIRFERGDFAESKRYYEEYLKYNEQNPRSLWLGIRLMHVLGDDDRVASYALFLKNEFPDSPEYKEYAQWAASK
ncbi:MAG TPA: type IV pilus biogenesis/stability protein PilW [Pseudomonadales bacterium]|nr:type IV pilus biogenesis/stability protein PilW [Pseudomonadales bacterium]